MHLHKMDCHAATDVGRQRSVNEDQYLLADLVKAVQIQSTSLSYEDHDQVAGQSHGKILLVADGLGGEVSGSRASTLAVDETINYMVNRMRWSSLGESAEQHDPQGLKQDLVAALRHCQHRIRDETSWNSEREGMGTTLTVAIIDWPDLHIVHAGDCRCYLDHQNQIQQITEDQSVSRIEPKPLRDSLASPATLSGESESVLGGSSSSLEPKVYSRKLSIGDTLLLCTDGLYQHLGDDQIAKALRQRQSAQQICQTLIEQANSAGGTDNVTVAIAKFCDISETPLEMMSEAAVDEPTSPQIAIHTELDPSPVAAPLETVTPDQADVHTYNFLSQ